MNDPASAPLLSDLTDREHQLVNAARSGATLTCSDLGVNELATSSATDHLIRAELIRELLLGRRGEVDPCGVRLAGARIIGELDLSFVHAKAGLALGNCALDQPIYAVWATLPSLLLQEILVTIAPAEPPDGDDEITAINLFGTHVAGPLILKGGWISNANGPALNASGTRIEADLLLRRVALYGNSDRGAIDLSRAHIGGVVSLKHVEIAAVAGPALNANGVRIETDLVLSEGFLEGADTTGVVKLVAARIGRQVLLNDVRVVNTNGPALNANGTRIDADLFLTRVALHGNGDHGAMNLIRAHIGGDVHLENAQFINTSGSAWLANRWVVDGSFFLRREVRFEGGGKYGAINLMAARIGGRLGVGQDGAQVQAEAGTGVVLDLRETTVSTTMALPPDLLCPDKRMDNKCPHPQQVRLDDFTYAALGPEWDWRRWLHLIRCHTPGYHASAYQQLAAVERAAGHDGNVRQILIAQQHDLRRRAPAALGGRVSRLFHWLWGALAGYGYRARRTATALLLALVLAGGLGWWAGQVTTRPGHYAAERVAPPGSRPGDLGTPAGPTGTRCSFVELVGLGLDRGLPLGLTGLRNRCDMDTESRTGQAFLIAIWAVQLAVWGLATLALAGYTNLVRKIT